MVRVRIATNRTAFFWLKRCGHVSLTVKLASVSISSLISNNLMYLMFDLCLATIHLRALNGSDWSREVRR